MKLWHDREIKGKIKSGSFNEDSRGRWYVSLVVEVEAKPPQNNDSIGIDLGCKTKFLIFPDSAIAFNTIYLFASFLDANVRPPIVVLLL